MTCKKAFRIEISRRLGGPWLCVGWEDRDGVNFHIFVHEETLALREDSRRNRPVIYRNPPTGSDAPDKPGYFPTRYLSLDAPRNRACVDAVLQAVKAACMVQAFQDREKIQAAQAEAEARARFMVHLAQEAGPALLMALKAVMDAYKVTRETAANVHQEAAVILALAAIKDATTLPSEVAP